MYNSIERRKRTIDINSRSDIGTCELAIAVRVFTGPIAALKRIRAIVASVAVLVRTVSVDSCEIQVRTGLVEARIVLTARIGSFPAIVYEGN